MLHFWTIWHHEAWGIIRLQINVCRQKTEYLPPGLPCLAEGEIPDMGVFLPATANAVATEALIAWHFLLWVLTWGPVQHREKKYHIKKRKECKSSPVKVAALLLPPYCCCCLALPDTSGVCTDFFCNKIECMEKDSLGLFFSMIFWPQCFTGLTLQPLMISGNFVPIV